MRVRITNPAFVYDLFEDQARAMGVINSWRRSREPVLVGTLGNVIAKAPHLWTPDSLVYAVKLWDGSVILMHERGIEFIPDFEEIYNALT